MSVTVESVLAKLDAFADKYIGILDESAGTIELLDPSIAPLLTEVQAVADKVRTALDALNKA